MSSLWRTQRPRFPLYAPDGRGRDYYIKYTNGGYWENQFHIRKKPDYERTRYSNFHTLFHAAAPFKYWGNGHGRETYVLETNGLFHEQKPLYSYKLSDFLRNDHYGGKSGNINYRKKKFMSVSEKKYNEELRRLEKKLVKRLYTEPMNIKRSMMRCRTENEDGTLNHHKMYQTFTSFPKNYRNCSNNYNNSSCKNIDGFYDVSNKERLNTEPGFEFPNYGKLNFGEEETKLKGSKNKFSKTSSNFYKNKFGSASGPLYLNTENDNTFKVGKNNFDALRICSTENYINPVNDLRFIDPRGKYSRTMNAKFTFKPKPKLMDNKNIKKFKNNKQ